MHRAALRTETLHGQISCAHHLRALDNGEQQADQFEYYDERYPQRKKRDNKRRRSSSEMPIWRIAATEVKVLTFATCSMDNERLKGGSNADGESFERRLICIGELLLVSRIDEYYSSKSSG